MKYAYFINGNKDNERTDDCKLLIKNMFVNMEKNILYVTKKKYFIGNDHVKIKMQFKIIGKRIKKSTPKALSNCFFFVPTDNHFFPFLNSLEKFSYKCSLVRIV